jgi:hypothetical protein
VTQPNDEDWRAIVENFGDTPDADRIEAEVDSTQPSPVEPESDSWADEGRYVPPPPPPLPRLPTKQRAAWACLLGGPALLLVCLFTGFRPPSIVMMAVLVAILGSFVYLIFGTPRTPREPWEDGAQI